MKEKKEINKILENFYDTYLLSDFFLTLSEDEKSKIKVNYKEIKRIIQK